VSSPALLIIPLFVVRGVPKDHLELHLPPFSERLTADRFGMLTE
jgi:hypothetical protein